MSVKIRKYKRGGWELDIRIERPGGGEHRERRKSPVSSKSGSKRWGERRERELLDELSKPKDDPLEDRKEVPALKDFVPRFLEGYAKANRQKPSTLAAKESILRVHLVPLLGDKPLDTIANEDVQAVKTKLHEKAPATVNTVLTTLNVMLNVAVEWGVIEAMPCEVKLLRVPPSEASFYDFDEYERLVAASTGPTLAIVLLGGEAGLRCGEMLALEWTDIDFTNRRLTVNRSDWRGAVTTPKGGRSRRIPMTSRLAATLQSERHLRGPRVLCQRDGSPLTKRMVQRLVEKACRRANLRAKGVHILRHTFCSHLAMKGAPAKAIQELAGHRDLSTTQKYMHLSPAAIDSAIRLLDQKTVSDFGDMLETANGSIPNLNLPNN